MRPVRLEITAFGPFAGTEVVDFDLLAGAGLFLVHGETGAGKTSVLDALCFALYGSVPGARDRARDLRSDHAHPATLTSVRLDFDVAGERYQIWRQPKQVAGKRRGGGSTAHQSKVVLFRGTPPELVSNRLDEVGLLMHDLMGMTADQFCQVVLLPQGDFARFLRADAKDRQQLLERLFAAERYHDIEALLAADKAAAAARLGELGVRADRLLHQLATEARLMEPPADADESWPSAVTALLGAQAQEAAAVATAANVREQDARSRHDAAVALDAAQRRVTAARARRAALVAAAPSRAAWAHELRLARCASPVVPHLDRAATSAAAAAAAVGHAADMSAALGAAPAESSAAALADQERRLRELAAGLLAVEPVEREHAEASVECASLDSGLSAVVAERAAVGERLLLVQTALARLDEITRAGELVAGGIAAQEAECAHLEAQHSASIALEAATAQLRDAREQQLDLEAEVNCARADQLAVLARRLDGIAAELAQRLVDGEPCGVCGATEHPAPARPSDPVTPDDEEAAERRCVAAAEGAAAGRRRVEKSAARVAALRADAGDKPAVELAPLVVAARANLHAARATLRAAERAAPETRAATDEMAALTQSVSKLDTDAAQLTARRAAVGEVLGRRSADVAAARAGHESIAARVAALEARIALAAAAARAADEADRAATAARTDTKAAVAAATLAGFEGVEDARSSVRDDDACARLDSLCAEYDRSLDRVEAELADPALDVALEPAADVAAALAALDTAVDAARRAHATADDLTRRAQRLAALGTQLGAVHALMAPTRATYDEVAVLADLANGVNRLRMPLSAFVLAARLEQVAAAASSRLARMTSGRYTLVHTDEVGDARRKAGLGIKVCDSWTGTSREAASLSGGETFMASLALALALADVVREEAGGSRIDCLFVDEGFGSLDEQTLDEVMDVLDQLRDGGRLVGLVSHVPELRQRIPAQLRVLKGVNGSRVAVCTDEPVFEPAG